MTNTPIRAQVSLRWAVETVFEEFRASEAAGFHTKDREFAITILGKALEVNPAGTDDLRPGLAKAMEIVGNMRQSEAGLLDAKHSGQRGCDRSDALYDAHQAIGAALSTGKAI